MGAEVCLDDRGYYAEGNKSRCWFDEQVWSDLGLVVGVGLVVVKTMLRE